MWFNRPGDVVGEIAGYDPKGSDKVQVWARKLELASAGGTMPGLAVAAVNFANETRTVQIPLIMVASGWGSSYTSSPRHNWILREGCV